MRIRYYGHVGMQTGYGRAATEMCRSLLRAGVEIEVRPLGITVPRAIEALTHDVPLAKRIRPDASLTPDPDAIIVHSLPLDCPRIAELARVGKSHVIAYTTWETVEAPRAVAAAMDYFDDVWVPSRATARAFDGRSPVIIPHAYDDTQSALPAIGHVPGAPFRFYYVGQWNRRKNPAGVIRAFAATFSTADKVELHLHCPGATVMQLATEMASTGIDRADLAPITLSNNIASEAGIQRMHDTFDCFVTASRGEAWNLPAFEALRAGRMILSPHGLGSDDFLMDTDSLLYGSTADPVFSPAALDVEVLPPQPDQPPNAVALSTPGAQGVTSRDLWREPDLVALGRAMRRVFHLAKRTNTIHYDLASAFGYAAVAKQVLSELEK